MKSTWVPSSSLSPLPPLGNHRLFQVEGITENTDLHCCHFTRGETGPEKRGVWLPIPPPARDRATSCPSSVCFHERSKDFNRHLLMDLFSRLNTSYCSLGTRELLMKDSKKPALASAQLGDGLGGWLGTGKRCREGLMDLHFALTLFPWVLRINLFYSLERQG